MSIRFSLLLIAAGAILALAVEFEAQGVDLQTLGVIFVAGGVIGVGFAGAARLSRGLSRRRHEHADEKGSSDERREAVLRDR